jgi:fibronectin type 3 domain-containing protein
MKKNIFRFVNKIPYVILILGIFLVLQSPAYITGVRAQATAPSLEENTYFFSNNVNHFSQIQIDNKSTTNVTIVPGTIAISETKIAAVTLAIQNNYDVLPGGVKYFAVTDIREINNWAFVSMIGFSQYEENRGWSIENGEWFGIILLHEDSEHNWYGAVQGSEEYSTLVMAIPENILSLPEKKNLDPLQKPDVAAASNYVFPWQSGTSMLYGVLGVHDNGFPSIVSGWKAVDMVSDGNTSAGHAPNRLLASETATISYVCNDGTSVAVRMGNFFYLHLLNNSNLYVGKTFNQKDEMGQLKTGSFDANCGYASQSSSSFHVHWGFPNADLQVENWTLSMSSQNWTNGSSTVSPNGGWILAGGSPSSCPGPSLNSPGDGQVFSGQTIDFNWSAPSGCTFEGYTFRIKTTSSMDSGGTTIQDTGNSLTSRTETISTQYNNMDLYWGVRTANPLSPNWSVRRFRIEPGSTGCNINSEQVGWYADSNYGGTCVVKGVGEYSSPSAMGFPNDSMSSVKVGSNVKLTLCHDDNYAGGCEDFTGDDSNLADNSIGDNQASSAKVISVPTSCTPSADQVALFADANYGGTCVVKDIGNYSNPSNMGFPNDSLSSVKVGGNVKLTLCQNDDYSGTCETLTGDDSNLADNSVGDNQASSAKVESRIVCTSGATPLQGGYTFCANEGGLCSFSGQASVAFGGSSCYFYQTFSDGVSCQNGLFGDPWVGFGKSCYFKSLVTAPSAPSNLKGNGSASGNASITMTWNDNSNNESGFEIYRSVNGGAFVGITTTAANATSYTNQGLYTGNTCAYEVRAINGAGSSGFTNIASVPRAPAAIRATGLIGSTPSIKLTWADNSNNETGFQIYRNVNGGAFTGYTTTAANATAYIDKAVISGKAYAYEVRAINANATSAFSDIASVPVAPSGLTATGVTGSTPSIKLTWTDSSGNESGFQIYRNVNGGAFSGYTTTLANATSYVDKSVVAGTAYAYEVRAITAYGMSVFTNIASVPVSPTSLTLTKVSSTSIRLNWVDRSGNESGFQIYRRVNGGSFTGYTTTAANATSYTDVSAYQGNTYSYEVRAVTGYGYSVFTNTAAMPM